MEKNIIINTNDNHLIYGTLNSKKKSKKLVIFVHGLLGNRNEHIFYNSSKFFTKSGFDTFRFDLYNGRKKGRKLRECTLEIHSKDTNAVVDYFRKKYDKIFLVGHSYGSLAVLKSDLSSVSAIILWDAASTTNTEWASSMEYIEGLDAYLLSWGMDYIIGKHMLNESKKLPHPKELMFKISIPIKIICAGKSSLVKDGNMYYKYAKKPKEFVIIKNARHNFNEEGSEELLFKETLNFVKKY